METEFTNDYISHNTFVGSNQRKFFKNPPKCRKHIFSLFHSIGVLTYPLGGLNLAIKKFMLMRDVTKICFESASVGFFFLLAEYN